MVLGPRSQSLAAVSNFRARILNLHVPGCRQSYLSESSQTQALFLPMRKLRLRNGPLLKERSRADVQKQDSKPFSMVPQAILWTPCWDKDGTGTLFLLSRALCPGRSWRIANRSGRYFPKAIISHLSHEPSSEQGDIK